MRRRRTRETPEWGRGKLLAVLVTGVAGVMLAVCGLALGVYYSALADPDDAKAQLATAEPPADEQPGLGQDSAAAARPGDLTTEQFEEIVVPAPEVLGRAGVSSGFPRTPEGALAQLVAIDQHVLQSASVDTAQRVITEWAVTGGPTAESWSGVHAVAALLSSSGVTRDGSTALTVAASPEMGLIDSSGDEVLACVNFVVTAFMTKTASVAAADCQRMTWVDGRWMIAAGPEPDQAPSVWPGTEAALQAGYRVLR